MAIYAGTCVYNPITDVRAVDPHGFVDLVECKETGSMPADVSGTEPEYNGVEDPASLMEHAVDVFDGIRKANMVVSANAAAAAEAAAANPEGASE